MRKECQSHFHSQAQVLQRHNNKDSWTLAQNKHQKKMQYVCFKVDRENVVLDCLRSETIRKDKVVLSC